MTHFGYYGIAEMVQAGAKYQDITRISGRLVPYIESTRLHADYEVDIIVLTFGVEESGALVSIHRKS